MSVVVSVSELLSFEHVDAIVSQYDSSSTLKCSYGFISEIPLIKSNSMLNQFPVGIHPYIVDVKVYDHCGYRALAALLGTGEESWAIVCMNLSMTSRIYLFVWR